MANWKEKRTRKKEQRDFHILRKLLLCLDLYFSRCVYRFPERDRDRDSPPIVTSHGNYFRCFRFCHDNCDLTETTVRNDCVATTFIHSRLPRPIHHYFGWDLESRCAPRLLRKENRRSARCLLPLSFRREKRVCRFNCPSFFQLFLFLFFFIPPFSSQKINGRFSPTRIRPFVSFSSSFVEKTNAIRLN